MPAWHRHIPKTVAVACLVATIAWMDQVGDLPGYLTVGDLALSGGHIYEESPPGVNTWPPFFSLLCIPLALLAKPSHHLVQLLWIVTNLFAFWGALKLLALLVYERPLSLRPDGTSLSLASFEIFVPLVICHRFILNNFTHLQINPLIFMITIGALYLHKQGDDLRAGVALGLAAALKVMPVLFIPYFVYRRQLRVEASGRDRSAGRR